MLTFGISDKIDCLSITMSCYTTNFDKKIEFACNLQGMFPTWER